MANNMKKLTILVVLAIAAFLLMALTLVNIHRVYLPIVLKSFPAFTSTPTQTSTLDNATFYKGPRPSPSDVTFTNSLGNLVSVFAYPGQVNIAVPPKTDIATVQALVGQLGGTILSQIPVLGLYLIQVPVGNEASFITEILKNSIVLNASPNPVLELQEVVDLSDTGKEPHELLVALLSSPDPNATVILAQIDDFVDPHGNNVEAARNEITGDVNSLRIHIGQLPCRLPAALCSSGDQAIRALTAAIAGAELNGQKININISWGVNPSTTDPTQFSTTNGPGSNAWAVNSWEAYMQDILDVLAASDWVMKGNVTLNKSADNGALLIDANNNILQRIGIDLTDANNRLRTDTRYGPLMGNVVTLYGAVNPDGTLASYSNHGSEIIYGEPFIRGTSFVAPQGQGATYLAWISFPDLTAAQITQAVRNAADTNASGFDILDVAGTYDEAQAIAGVTYTLTITKTGTGIGTVSASPPGPTYTAGTVVTLAATPDTGSTFAGWSGACAGTGACLITMNEDKIVVANFATTTSCTYTYSDWSACQPDNTQTRTVISSSPAGCSGTPVLSQSCTYAPTCCACTFDVYCTVFGPGGCWRCYNSTYTGGVCQAPYGYLTSPGACTCDPELYEVCQ